MDFLYSYLSLVAVLVGTAWGFFLSVIVVVFGLTILISILSIPFHIVAAIKNRRAA